MSEQGRLRAVRFPDLLIAATAERHNLAVIHDDRDYDLIAEVTNQATEWVVPHGSFRTGPSRDWRPAPRVRGSWPPNPTGRPPGRSAGCVRCAWWVRVPTS